MAGDAVIFAGARTPIGRYGGALSRIGTTICSAWQ
jgi:hypothetical protein